MDTINRSELDSQITQPWNKGKLTGAKPPLRPKHVWAVRTRLQLTVRLRDLALFNLAIDSKLRGCDVVGLKVVQARRRDHDAGTEDRLASAALELINSSSITALFVVEDGRPIGIIHIHDLLRAGVA